MVSHGKIGQIVTVTVHQITRSTFSSDHNRKTAFLYLFWFCELSFRFSVTRAPSVTFTQSRKSIEICIKAENWQHLRLSHLYINCTNNRKQFLKGDRCYISHFISLVALLEDHTPSFHEDHFTRTQMKMRGNGYKLHCEFNLVIKKEFFYSENNHSLKQCLQGHVRFPILGAIQDAIGQGDR